MAKKIAVLTTGPIPVINKRGPIMTATIISDAQYAQMEKLGVRMMLVGKQPDADDVETSEDVAVVEATPAIVEDANTEETIQAPADETVNADANTEEAASEAAIVEDANTEETIQAPADETVNADANSEEATIVGDADEEAVVVQAPADETVNTDEEEEAAAYSIDEIKAMTKDQLIALAGEYEIEIEEKDTKKIILDKILANTSVEE